MKQMKYNTKRIIEVLDSGTCNGYNYYILNLGTHPTAYVEIPKNHKFYRKHYDEISIDVHGGLTYSKDKLFLGKENKENSWFIGWDYAHLGDFSGFEMLFSNFSNNEDKKWTTEEIQADVFDVCRQLKKWR